ncbi:hypothetical protein [Streptomyces sp. NPDC054849]
MNASGTAAGSGAGSAAAGAGYRSAQPSSSRRRACMRGGRGSKRPLSQFFTVCGVDFNAAECRA